MGSGNVLKATFLTMIWTLLDETPDLHPDAPRGQKLPEPFTIKPGGVRPFPFKLEGRPGEYEAFLSMQSGLGPTSDAILSPSVYFEIDEEGKVRRLDDPPPRLATCR